MVQTQNKSIDDFTPLIQAVVRQNNDAIDFVKLLVDKCATDIRHAYKVSIG